MEWTKAYDPSRLVNPASGGNHYLTGDILDTHHYPNPRLTLLSIPTVQRCWVSTAASAS